MRVAVMALVLGLGQITGVDAEEIRGRIVDSENGAPVALAVEAGGVYAVDVEMRPEPFRLDPLEVVVRNEEPIRYLTLEFGMNPHHFTGFRAIQGAQLEKAKVRAVDNTHFLRFLYIPVSHGFDVCVGSFGMDLAERGVGEEGGERPCGQLFLNGIQCRNEHIEEISTETVAVVVTLPGQLRLFTREFDWTFNRAGYAGSC